MSFFDELTQKAKNVAGAASERAKEAADTAKLSAEILKEKRELDKRYREIGQWYANEYNGEVPADIADVMSAVKELQERITALQAERDERGGGDSDPEEVGKVCPVCGKISDSKFCPHCGAPMGD
ncbi:MAG: zinc ribbon domain-containing protein [Oscillospiraceae bacterium]|nr:zinc ribbon domain-containing protein [Oscillospiraceae bacterium]